MLVAISQRQQYNKNGAPIDVLEQSYLTYFESYGIQMVLIPNVRSLVDYYFDHFHLEGIILTGGEDIDPKVYGESIDWPNISPLRDQVEKRMLEIALARKIPVLGICRGMQFINVFFGGKMVKNIKDEITLNHAPGKDHQIILNEKKVISLFGKREITVNSYHNQAVTTKTLSPLLNIFALAELGIIEGLYHPSLPLAGIQWHPERGKPDTEINKNVIGGFVKRKLYWGKI